MLLSLPKVFALCRGAIRRERPAFQPAFRPPTNFLPLLSGSGEKRQAVVQIPLDGIWLVAAGIRSTENGYIRICKSPKKGVKIPLVKVLEILKNFFQEVFKQGSGQSPEVLTLKKEYTWKVSDG